MTRGCRHGMTHHRPLSFIKYWFFLLDDLNTSPIQSMLDHWSIYYQQFLLFDEDTLSNWLMPDLWPIDHKRFPLASKNTYLNLVDTRPSTISFKDQKHFVKFGQKLTINPSTIDDFLWGPKTLRQIWSTPDHHPIGHQWFPLSKSPNNVGCRYSSQYDIDHRSTPTPKRLKLI